MLEGQHVVASVAVGALFRGDTSVREQRVDEQCVLESRVPVFVEHPWLAVHKDAVEERVGVDVVAVYVFYGYYIT